MPDPTPGSGQVLLDVHAASVNPLDIHMMTGTPMLVVIPPWRDAGAIVQAAGGWIIAPRAAPFAVLAAADGTDFPDSLRAGGAWWVMSGDALASICGAS